jgi:hypothetical protein
MNIHSRNVMIETGNTSIHYVHIVNTPLYKGGITTPPYMEAASP